MGKPVERLQARAEFGKQRTVQSGAGSGWRPLRGHSAMLRHGVWMVPIGCNVKLCDMVVRPRDRAQALSHAPEIGQHDFAPDAERRHPLIGCCGAGQALSGSHISTSPVPVCGLNLSS